MSRPARPWTADADRGAVLILVLVVVTVIGLATGALLTLSETSIRTTVALREQSARAYAADAAGQVAVAKLRNLTYPDDCATAGVPLPLGDGTHAFYPALGDRPALNAYVTCTPDLTSGSGVVIGPANTPDFALFTLGTDADVIGQEFGGASNKTVTLTGNVVSASSIDTRNNTLAVPAPGRVLARTAADCVGTFSPTPCAGGSAAFPVPSYPAPTDPVSTAPPPVCSGGYAAFRPGLMDQAYLASHLNAGCGQSSVVWFSPGTYYFTFDGSWNAPTWLVGGTPTDGDGVPIAGLDPADATTLSLLSRLNRAEAGGACVNPQVAAAPGVMFVFGGDSRIYLADNKLEICATYAARTVPIAVYGPTSAIPPRGGTGPAVPAQTPCTSDACAVFSNFVDGHGEFQIQGHVYAPNARMVLSLKNSPGQNFNWGLVVRSFSIAVNGRSPRGAVARVPGHSPPGTRAYAIHYLNVWVCPRSGTACDHSGPPRLRAKVQILGSPPTATVLSWSVQR